MMEHRRWNAVVTVNEHNALYDAWKVEATNTAQARVQLAMLRGASVDLTGCQAELFTAGDLGITLADDQAEFDLEGVA